MGEEDCPQACHRDHLLHEAQQPLGSEATKVLHRAPQRQSFKRTLSQVLVVRTISQLRDRMAVLLVVHMSAAMALTPGQSAPGGVHTHYLVFVDPSPCRQLESLWPFGR